MVYKIIHEAETPLDKKARIFYMYNQERRRARAMIFIPPEIILRNSSGMPLETVLFNVDFNRERIISKLNYKLETKGVFF